MSSSSLMHGATSYDARLSRMQTCAGTTAACRQTAQLHAPAAVRADMSTLGSTLPALSALALLSSSSTILATSSSAISYSTCVADWSACSTCPRCITCSTGVSPDQCVCASCSRGDDGASRSSVKWELRTPAAMRAAESSSIRIPRPAARAAAAVRQDAPLSEEPSAAWCHACKQGTTTPSVQTVQT